ncbi:hypothetical protein TR13x_05755 [Caloranaerobacter sp. TR13]|uniref:LacI family DNA-binding transcriptional regulator n=1 Tax=Caloranaerobacter sp. TR13 TaxID=1302151 RepID=UPI0006D4710F|nr:LacI family DNA-binding transcriptional regulator [Caloranaerobacter sp. TR13]KPU27257.1 hypothetical protein TR13x_05755 [Caloranaerobacter sp. TR13]
MKVTISDIARIAGVSKSTVSRVLNNSKPVSEEVRKKVLKAIEDTNYKPSLLARSLANKKTNLIGVVIPDVSNSFFSELVRGIQDYAGSKSYNILLCNTYFDHTKEIQYLNILSEQEVEGIIFLTSKIVEEHVDFFRNFRKPVVIVNRKIEELNIPCVDVDNFKASYEAVNYLINLNHNRIGMIRGPLNNKSVGLNRFEGYKKALEDNGIEFNEDLVVEGNFTINDGYKAMGKLLSLRDIPTAVFCASDSMAIGAIKCIMDSGFKVPDDISIIGFDGIPMASIFVPSITTIAQPILEMGTTAIKMIFDQLEGKEVKDIIMPTELEVRQSTKRRI